MKRNVFWVNSSRHGVGQCEFYLWPVCLRGYYSLFQAILLSQMLWVPPERIRIHGIDAPEGRQTCTRGQTIWLCGKKAAKAMIALVRGSEVKCEAIDTDRYGRIVGKCFANGRDVGEALVMDDLALAYRQYSTDYIQVEASAKAARRGLWAGEFVAPWDWRKGKRLRTRLMMRSRPRVGT